MTTMSDLIRKAAARKLKALRRLKRAEIVTGRLVAKRRPVLKAIAAYRDAGRSVPQSLWEKHQDFQKKLAKAAHVEHQASVAYEAARRS